MQIATRLWVSGFTTEQAAWTRGQNFKALHTNCGQHQHHIYGAEHIDFQLLVQGLEQTLGGGGCVCVYDACLWFLQPASLADFHRNTDCALFNQSCLVAHTEEVRWCGEERNSGVVERAHV